LTPIAGDEEKELAGTAVAHHVRCSMTLSDVPTKARFLVDTEGAVVRS
jgi:hypothetical protein